ncbi:MAG: glycoside hydrolase family 15 protein [Jatrophihabitans sp.]|uniref:glycoside hydrolase family 15 protein n=1 Tax=Jatrophihabitans sp. TaxID=1932789 RepID=UPI003F7F759F
MTEGSERPGGVPLSAASPAVLREYALLADGERGALVGPSGDVAWLCAPRWHDASVFSSLLGGQGTFMLHPTARHVWGGFYETSSLVWHSHWVTTDGWVESHDALHYPADPHRLVLLRRIVAESADAGVFVLLRPRGDYDTVPMTDLHRHGDIWTARVGDLWLRVQGLGHARPREHGAALVAEFTVAAHDRHDIVLELSDRELPDRPPDADVAWEGTRARWGTVVPDLSGTLSPSEAGHHYAVLQGLTSATSGMVAAASTSLPERAEAGRNYDYRYAWIRDQCYAGEAVAALGALPLLDHAVDFVSARLLEHGPDLAPAYTVEGGRVPDQRTLDLSGYPGGEVVVGNWVNDQFQLDIFGESLLLFAAAAEHDRLTTEHWDAAQVAADAIGKRWHEPDAGIWEIEPRAWTHSRLTAVAGLRAIARVRPASAATIGWSALADRILADTSADATHDDGSWQRSPGDPLADAALLLPGLRGAVPADDPRTVATLQRYLDELARDGYAYRFRHDDRPLHDAEGSFLLCGFLVALSEHQRGRAVEARAWYERTQAACGPPMLYCEEFDPQQHQLRGNLPQAFVHALMLETSARLAT